MCEIIKATEIAKAVGCTRHQVNYNIKNNVWNFGRTVKRGSKKKVREAIELIRMEINALEGLGNCRRVIEAKRKKHIALYNTAIEALEKQLPKKAEYEGGFSNNGFTRYRMAKCPDCDRWHSSRDEIIYCSKCGQRLDWSE